MNLNNPLNFAKATMGDLSGLASLFNHGSADWDILEAEYNGIIFHVFESSVDWKGALEQVQDSGGRRKVKYKFPYQDGQTTDDLGRTGETFTLNVVLHGENYLTAFKKLFTELNKAEPGILIHPIRGAIECVMETYSILHKSDSRKAMAISLVMTEHNFDVANIEMFTDDPSVKSLLSKALELFQNIQSFILKVQGTIIWANSIKNKIIGLAENFKTNYALFLGKSNSAFNGGPSMDMPTLLPVNKGGNLNTDGTTTSDNFTSVSSPSDPFRSVPVSELTQGASAAVVASQIEKEMNTLRDDINEIIALIESSSSVGALEFKDDILAFKAMAVMLQQIIEAGRKSSNASILNYLVPRIMSIREVAFINGVPLNRVNEIDLLNPELPSVNYIEKGSVVKVPV